jgi:hypothetical protein
MTPKSHTRVAVAGRAGHCARRFGRARGNLEARHASAVQEPAHLHRDGSQGRESEQGRGERQKCQYIGIRSCWLRRWLRSHHMEPVRRLVVTALGVEGTTNPGTVNDMECPMLPAPKLLPSEQLTVTVAVSPAAAIVQS